MPEISHLPTRNIWQDLVKNLTRSCEVLSKFFEHSQDSSMIHGKNLARCDLATYSILGKIDKKYIVMRLIAKYFWWDYLQEYRRPFEATHMTVT